MIIYVMISLVAMAGVVSLGVDLGRVQLVKTEMRACADATALGALNVLISSDLASANYWAPQLAAANPVDAGSGVSPIVTITWGTWNAATNTFAQDGGTSAVRVTVARTTAGGNPLPLTWARLVGKNSIDLTVDAVATIVGGQNGGVTVNSASNPYLAGMPSGTATIWGDNMTNATPYQVTSIPVVPGTWITLANASGTSSIVPGSTGYVGPDGDPTRPLRHGENWDGTPYVPGSENGIADAKMPADALYGVFLTDSAPDSTPAPAGQTDWTSAGVGDQPAFGDIDLKTPFMLGNGQTSTGVVQRFLVPPGATRLYLGVWDGVCNSNNAGTLTATIAVKRTAKLVK
jgi:hypothetical protein